MFASISLYAHTIQMRACCTPVIGSFESFAFHCWRICEIGQNRKTQSELTSLLEPFTKVSQHNYGVNKCGTEESDGYNSCGKCQRETRQKNFNFLTEYCQGFPKLTIWFFRPVQKHLYKLSACDEQILRHNVVKIHLINKINHGTDAT